MRKSTLLYPSLLACGAALAACGEATPDAKNAGDVATVEVAPPPEKPDPPAAATAEPITPPEQTEKPGTPPKETASKPQDAGPPPPAAPLTGPAAPSGGTATVVASAQAPTAALTALATTDAPGMQPAGSTFAASFKAGQTLEAPLTVQPGRCYTILAAGAPTVQQIEITLTVVMPQLPIPPAVLAQGSGTQSAALGGKGSCFRNPMPLAMPATVIVKVTSGAGVVGVQVYGK